MMILSALIYFVNFELYYYYIVSMQYQNPIIKKISYIFERECTFFHYESSYLFFPPLFRRCPSLRKQGTKETKKHTTPFNLSHYVITGSLCR